MRSVVDTNVLVSAVILPHSVPRQAVDKTLDNNNVLLISEHTLTELAEVLLRTKFDRYISREERGMFLAELESVAEIVPIIQLVRECHDPRDDKFLEVALNGRADVIVTGDDDLLEMHPWHGVEILTSAEYLRR